MCIIQMGENSVLIRMLVIQKYRLCLSQLILAKTFPVTHPNDSSKGVHHELYLYLLSQQNVLHSYSIWAGLKLGVGGA